MNVIWTALTGGFLKGKRTELAGLGIFLHGLIGWLMGDITLATFGENVDQMLIGFGVVGARGAIEQLIKAIGALQAAGVGKPADPPAP